MPSNPTIYDVSRLSGVSTATVSRAFSRPEHVKEHTRRKVYEAAEALHYSPNAIARAMAPSADGQDRLSDLQKGCHGAGRVLCGHL